MEGFEPSETDIAPHVTCAVCSGSIEEDREAVGARLALTETKRRAEDSTP
jgi:predicted nucleic acid-binding Zn ribbon protein